MSIDRRQFERLPMSDEAIAVEESGRLLGKISQASGGGMTVVMDPSGGAGSLGVGQKLRVTVLEPGSQTSHTIDVVVRSQDGKHLGLEFI